MSRKLPAHASLEHLKKQAKRLLDDLRHADAAAKLADAQHAIARGYGFATWPALKAHVGSLASESPFAGVWDANLSKSQRHPLNPFRAATLEFTVAGDVVAIVNDEVDESGRSERGEQTIQADGQERGVGHGYSITANWRGPRVLETLAKQDGRIVGRGTYEVSADGKTLTISTRDPQSNARGWRSEAEHVIVLDRARLPT